MILLKNFRGISCAALHDAPQTITTQTLVQPILESGKAIFAVLCHVNTKVGFLVGLIHKIWQKNLALLFCKLHEAPLQSQCRKIGENYPGCPREHPKHAFFQHGGNQGLKVSKVLVQGYPSNKLYVMNRAEMPETLTQVIDDAIMQHPRTVER